MIEKVAERARIDIRKREESFLEQMELEVLRAMQDVIDNVSRKRKVFDSHFYRVPFNVDGKFSASNVKSILLEVTKNLGLEETAIKEEGVCIFEVEIPKSSFEYLRKRVEEFEQKIEERRRELKTFLETFISQNIITKIEKKEYEFERVTATKVRLTVKITVLDCNWHIFKYELKKDRITICTMAYEILKEYGFMGVILSEDAVTWYIELAA